jgi:uncharacterized protein (UPF0332 family)
MDFDFSYVKKQPVNFGQINKILQKAYKTIQSAKTTLKTDPEACFTLAYESMLKTTLALMLSRGFRPKIQLGHHKTLVNYAKYVLKDRFSKITATYDRMRQKRNKLLYDVASVSETEAKQSAIVAEKYFRIVEQKIASDNPQQKLWKP